MESIQYGNLKRKDNTGFMLLAIPAVLGYVNRYFFSTIRTISDVSLKHKGTSILSI